jgi:drug/metabolite transporter (DMT)-like permease
MDWILLIVPGVIWGASFLFIAEGLEAMGPNGVTFTRILVGFVTLALFSGSRRAIRREDRLGTAAVGVLWMAFPLSMFPYAERHVSSALTGMLNGAVPLFIAIVAAGIARQWPSRSISRGLAVGLAGAVLMGLPTMGQGRSTVNGVLLILAALVSYGFALNIARPVQLRNGALPVIWRAQAVALVLTAPLGLPEMLRAHWSPGPVFSLLALGALGTGVAYVLTVMAAGRVGATKASATAFLIPPVALLLGVLVRGEHVAALSVLGGVVCLAGAWLMRRAQLEGRPNKSSSGSEKPGTTSSPSSTPSVASILGGRSG